jgi:SAM-dependent methyltransferase
MTVSDETPLRLNLGSGDTPREGFVNVDVRPGVPGVDVVHDLDVYPWPFDSECADEVVMVHCLEHLADRNRAMKEVYRVLRPGGVARITVPHFTWQYAYADPTHKHFFAYRTFFYYAGRGGYFDFGFESCDVRIVFGKRLSVWNRLLEPIVNLMPNVWEQSPLRVFPAVEIRATLVKGA